MARRRALRLSTRVTLFFAITALLGGIGLTVTTYLFARNSLLDQRTTSAEANARDNALDLNASMGEDPDTISEAVFGLDTDPDGWATLIFLLFGTTLAYFAYKNIWAERQVEGGKETTSFTDPHKV